MLQTPARVSDPILFSLEYSGSPPKQGLFASLGHSFLTQELVSTPHTPSPKQVGVPHVLEHAGVRKAICSPDPPPPHSWHICLEEKPQNRIGTLDSCLGSISISLYVFREVP